MVQKENRPEAAPQRQPRRMSESPLEDDEPILVDEGYDEVVTDEDAEPDDRRRDPLRQ